MKSAGFILKIIGAALAFAGAVCLVIGYWDVIYNTAAGLADRLHGCCCCGKESDDYAE